jgi:chromosome segregation ATPase
LDRAKREAFTVPEVVAYAKEMDDLETETGLSAHGVVKDLKEKAEKREKLLDEVDTLTKEVGGLDKKSKELLKAYNSKEEELLRKYESTEKDLKLKRELFRRLREVGADPADLDRLTTMIRAAKEVGYSPATFSEKLKLEESLLDRVRKLKGEIGAKQAEIEELDGVATDSRRAKEEAVKEERITREGLSEEIRKTEEELASLKDEKKQRQKEVDGLKEKLGEYEEAVAKVDRSLAALENAMDEDTTLIKLFKEPGSLTKEEVNRVAKGLLESAKRTPRLLMDPVNLMAIQTLSDLLERM